MISIIIPFHNERENLPVLINRLIETLQKIAKDYEVILVDDGSTDNSISNSKNQISKIKTTTQNVKLLQHRKRLGKGQALFTGLKNARGNAIVFMDADLQDDPEELPKFLNKIDEGYDFVNGVRVGRKDNALIRLYSSLAKHFLRIFLNSPYTDVNCGYKAFKRKVAADFTFYGNNFRFFPLAVYYRGYKVSEIPVANHPRIHGESKYGTNKIFVGFMDTLTAYFLYKFSERPLHFFGLIGGVLFTLGFLLSMYLTIERLFFGVLLYRRPALFLGILLIIVGIQIVMTGILGELIVYLQKKGDKSVKTN